MERDLIRERTLGGLSAAEAYGRPGGRAAAVDDDVLVVARARQASGESDTTIARHLDIGRTTLYRALQPAVGGTPFTAEEPAPYTHERHSVPAGLVSVRRSSRKVGSWKTHPVRCLDIRSDVPHVRSRPKVARSLVIRSREVAGTLVGGRARRR